MAAGRIGKMGEPLGIMHVDALANISETYAQGLNPLMPKSA
jgi:hypothetical protein